MSEVEQKAEARRADGGGQSVLGQHPSKIRTERETNLGNVCCLVNFRRELGPCPSHSLAVTAPEEYKYEVSTRVVYMVDGKRRQSVGLVGVNI